MQVPPAWPENAILSKTHPQSPTEEVRLTRIIQFHHPERMWPPLTDEQHARFLGADLQTYRRIHTRLADGVWLAAQQLLGDAAFAAQVDRLPFAPGCTVVGLGDSLTEDSQSWLELLKTVLSLRRPQDEVNVINEGVSGSSTADTIRRMTAVMADQPDWVICLLGTNDAARFGSPPAATLISPAETARNLGILRQMAVPPPRPSPKRGFRLGEGREGVRWVWITPPPCIEPQVADDWFLAPIPVRFTNADLSAIANIVQQRPELVVPLTPSPFPILPDPSLFLADGLHPSLEGQKAILRALTASLHTQTSEVFGRISP